MIRLLKDTDYNDYIELLHQLTTVGEVTQHNFEMMVLLQHLYPQMHRTFIYEIDGKAVGCITCLIEQKLAHSYKKVMHIEDVITHENYRGRNIATDLLNYTKEIAINNNCYKIILDCNENNVAFYNKVGFTETGVQMSIKF